MGKCSENGETPGIGGPKKQPEPRPPHLAQPPYPEKPFPHSGGTGVPGVKNGVGDEGGCLTQGAAASPHTPIYLFIPAAAGPQA